MNAKFFTPVIATMALFFGATAMASVGHGKDGIGQPGTAAEVTRTVEVKMGDIFFASKNINVKPGETVRFVLRNEGSLLHEFNIGNAAAHAAHQKRWQPCSRTARSRLLGPGKP